MITEQVTCDVCGKLKRDVNHWWMVAVSDSFRLRSWDETIAKNFKHVCGQECANTSLSRWMADPSKSK